MNDVQNGLGIKNIRDLVRRKISGVYEVKSATKEQGKKYKRAAWETSKKL